MYLKDENGQESVTLTMFVVGFIAATSKLLLSGITVLGIVITPFSGVEYSAAVAALGGVYMLRKRDKAKKDKDIK
jgi:glucose uptake protein GlcU